MFLNSIQATPDQLKLVEQKDRGGGKEERITNLFYHEDDYGLEEW